MDAVITSSAVTSWRGTRRGDAQAAQRTGMTEQQWWHAHAPYLEKVMDPRRFPLAARVGTAAGQEYQAAADPDRAFGFGLARILDGIEVLVRNRQVEWSLAEGRIAFRT
jgi:hypothetical protein